MGRGAYFTLIKTCVVCQLNPLRPHTQRSAERHGPEGNRKPFFSGNDFKFRKPKNKRAASLATSPVDSGGEPRCFFLYFFHIIFPLLFFLCLVSYQPMWRDADYSTESSERRSGVTARRRARKEERSGKFNPNKWHLGGVGRRGGAQSSAARPPPPYMHAPRWPEPPNKSLSTVPLLLSCSRRYIPREEAISSGAHCACS